MTNPSGDGSGIDDIPWATVFDPAANARALGAIQAEGFRAARSLVDRFATMARSADDSGQSSSATAQDAGPAGANGTPSLPDLEQLTRAWWSVAGQFLLGANRSPGSPRSDFNLESPGRDHGIDLRASAPECVTTEVWLHNRGTHDFGQVRLRCSDLLAHNGDLIRSVDITLTPPEVAMPPRCSRGIGIEVVVSEQIRPGTYRGNLLVEDNSALWLPVVLTVCAPTS